MPEVWRRVDRELIDVLRQIPRGPAGLFDLDDIASARETMRMLALAGAADADLSGVEITTRCFPWRSGEVPLRIYRPETAPRNGAAALQWFHSGGYVLGFAAQDDPLLAEIARKLEIVIVSVDYALSPEAPYPVAHEQGAAAFQWLRANAGSLGVNPERIALGGASAGGGLAAGVTLMLRDRNLAMPCCLALAYPMLDDRNETPSNLEILDLGIWDRETGLKAWQALLGDGQGRSASGYAAPAGVVDLSGLPATFIAVGELDLFRDDNVAFASKLCAARVATEFHLFPGAYHAWDTLVPHARSARAMQALRNEFLRKYLHG